MNDTFDPILLLETIDLANQGLVVFQKSADALAWECVYANRAAERIWGIESLKGLSAKLLCPPSYLEREWTNDELFTFDFPASGLRGGLSRPELIGERLVVWIKKIEVTPQSKLADSAWKGVWSLAEETMQFGGWLWDFETEQMIWSDGLYQLLGYQSEFLPADRSFFMSHIHPDDRDTVERLFVALPSYDADYMLEFRVLGVDGQERYLYLKGYTNTDEHTGNRVSTATIFNVSTLREIQGELERKVADLNHSNADLEQFAYVASHDLQEPLRKIVSFGERLSASSQEEDDREKIFYLDRILNATRRMQQMINNLLEFSRVSSAADAYQSTDLNDIVKNTLNDLELLIQEKNAKVEIEPLPTIEAIPTQMSQLFINLINNGLKFSRTEVPVHIKITCSKLPELGSSEGKLLKGITYYKIVVEDNGIGFDNNHAEKIFTIFKRLRGRSEFEGSGIGLSVCKKVVERHHGTISAQGVPNQGATFEVILPNRQA